MANIIDYLKETRIDTFETTPLNEVDFLILARFSYLPFDLVDFKHNKATIHHILHVLTNTEDIHKSLLRQEDFEFMDALKHCKRFSKMIVKDYVNDFCETREMQFAAVTIKLKGNLSYVSFRGTDNTLVGWKEDFNMSFTCPVPSQLKAVDYVNRIARKVRGKIILGGHSKGGNLAVYSAAFCKKRIQKRILSVYSFDGPGFNQETLNKPEYDRVSSRTTTYVPQSSVIGMLLGHEEKYIIIQSDEKGLAQHDVYSWQLADKKFIELSTVDDKSRFIDKTLKKWLSDMSVDERKVFVDTIYEVLVTTQAKTLKELKQSAWKNLKIIHNSFKGLDDKTKKALQTGFRYLIQSAKEEALTAINNKKKKEASSKRKRDKFLYFSNKEKKEQITSNKRSR